MGKGDRAFTWQRGDRTAPLPVLEKGVSDLSTAGSRGGTHEVRYLPFVDDIFRLIGKKFHVHGSIARVVSRADVPIFSRSEVIMSTGDEKGSALPAIGMLFSPIKILRENYEPSRPSCSVSSIYNR